jgi:hypothetical protein
MSDEIKAHLERYEKQGWDLPVHEVRGLISQLQSRNAELEKALTERTEERDVLVKGVENWLKHIAELEARVKLHEENARYQASESFKSEKELERKLEVARDALTWIKNHPYAERSLLVDKATKTLTATEPDAVFPIGNNSAKNPLNQHNITDR